MEKSSLICATFYIQPTSAKDLELSTNSMQTLEVLHSSVPKKDYRLNLFENFD